MNQKAVDCVLQMHCPDRPGIMAATTGVVARHDGDIREAASFGDESTGEFFVRIQLRFPEPDRVEAFRAEFERMAAQCGVRWRLHDVTRRPRIMIAAQAEMRPAAGQLKERAGRPVEAPAVTADAGRRSSPVDGSEDQAPPVSGQPAAAVPAADPVTKSQPDGHFYSPICDPRKLRNMEARLWPETPPLPLGIDFNDRYHRMVLSRFFPRHFGNYQYPETLDEAQCPGRFYSRNGQFSILDARVLFVLLNQWRPRRMIEVGSGYSSLLAAHVNHAHLGGRMDFTCIDPYPRGFLTDSIEGLTRVRISRVQEVELSLFERLGPGDVLFIDSSHVCKTGSDVNFLFFDVLPRLCRGVRIHLHDIFLPAEYPRAWVLEENRSWNEQYLLRALLMDSTRFKVLFGSNYAVLRFPELLCRALGVPRSEGFGGGSFWIQRRGLLG